MIKSKYDQMIFMTYSMFLVVFISIHLTIYIVRVIDREIMEEKLSILDVKGDNMLLS